MRVLKEEAIVEIEVRKSRFIAIAIPIEDLAELKAHVAAARAEHPSAAHVVHAAVVGADGEQYSYSDDKEPRNTAGRPALEVLKGSGITNILILIIRYFGGTLLGTGGLVKAYGDSVRAILEQLITEELIDRSRFKMTIPYNLYDLVKIELAARAAEITDEEFATEITIEGVLPSSEAQALVGTVANLSNGAVAVTISEE